MYNRKRVERRVRKNQARINKLRLQAKATSGSAPINVLFRKVKVKNYFASYSFVLNFFVFLLFQEDQNDVKIMARRQKKRDQWYVRCDDKVN